MPKTRLVRFASTVALSSALGLLACGSNQMQGTGTAGTSGGTTGSAGASAGGTTGSAGSGVAGTTGTAGTSGRAGTGGTDSAGTSGTAGTTGNAGTGGSGSGGTSFAGTSGSAGHGGTGGSGAAGSTAGSSGAGAGGHAGTGGSGPAGTTGSAGNTGTAGAGGGSSNCTGHALSLSANGTGSASDSAFAHAEMDLKTDLPIGNSKRTLEFWAFIKTTDWIGEKNQLLYYGGTADGASFGLDFGTPTVTGMSSNHATLNPFTGSTIRDDSGADLGITSSSDQWVHIALVWDQAAFITYVNGIAKITVPAPTSGSVTALSTTQSVIYLGCNPTNNNCFNGLFDELRVWNVARTAQQIKDSYNKPLVGNETGLVGYWKFDESTGTMTADAVTTSGHTAHAGTLKADTTAHEPTFVTPSVPLPLVCN